MNNFENFIIKATIIHDNKYNYSHVLYKNTYSKIIITCPIHGNFSQTAKAHVSGQGCPDCSKLKQIQTNRLRYGADYHQQTKHGIEKIKQSVMIKFGVDNVRKHPQIKQLIRDRVDNTNKLKYGITNISAVKILPILNKLNDIDWLFDQYIKKHKSSQQIALELNCNAQTILNYLKKQEIVIRQGYQSSYISINWLEDVMKQEGIYIQHALNGGEYQIPGTKLRADGYCKETNTIYEFHGDYWHGNPEIYSPEVINEVNGLTMGELYQKTIDRENKIKSLGYNLIIKWETK